MRNRELVFLNNSFAYNNCTHYCQYVKILPAIYSLVFLKFSVWASSRWEHCVESSLYSPNLCCTRIFAKWVTKSSQHFYSISQESWSIKVDLWRYTFRSCDEISVYWLRFRSPQSAIWTAWYTTLISWKLLFRRNFLGIEGYFSERIADSLIAGRTFSTFSCLYLHFLLNSFSSKWCLNEGELKQYLLQLLPHVMPPCILPSNRVSFFKLSFLFSLTHSLKLW